MVYIVIVLIIWGVSSLLMASFLRMTRRRLPDYTGLTQIKETEPNLPDEETKIEEPPPDEAANEQPDNAAHKGVNETEIQDLLTSAKGSLFKSGLLLLAVGTALYIYIKFFK